MKRFHTVNYLTMILFFLYLVGILSLMLLTINIEDINAPDFIFGIEIDKVVHFIVFLPYSLLLWLAFNKKFSRHTNFFISFLIPFTGILFAIATEFLQSLNPSRDFDINDIIVNIMSVIFASLLLNVIHYLNDRSR